MNINWEIYQRWVGAILVEQSIEPENDIKEHIHSEDCKCNPIIDWYAGVKNIVHNSYDNRELLEKLEKTIVN